MRTRLVNVSGSEQTYSASARPLRASKAGTISSARRISMWRPQGRACGPLPNLAHFQHERQDCRHWPRSPTGGDRGQPRAKVRVACQQDGRWIDKPVTLPPGRARLATRPVPSGSCASAKTIGMTDVACFAARTALPDVTMTSTFKRTNSAAISANRSLRPSAQRYSIAMVRPSIQPSSRSRSTKAAVHWPAKRVVPKNPTVGSFPACCARAAIGHARRAAEQRDELAALHSITSSARPEQ